MKKPETEQNVFEVRNGIHFMLAYPMVIKQEDYPSLKAAMDSLKNNITNVKYRRTK